MTKSRQVILSTTSQLTVEALQWLCVHKWYTTHDLISMQPCSQLALIIQESIDKSAEPNRALLEERYTIGKSPRFPNIRVYEKDGRYWELNDFRLRIWAVNMVCHVRGLLCLLTRSVL